MCYRMITRILTAWHVVQDVRFTSELWSATLLGLTLNTSVCSGRGCAVQYGSEEAGESPGQQPKTERGFRGRGAFEGSTY